MTATPAFPHPRFHAENHPYETRDSLTNTMEDYFKNGNLARPVTV